MAGHRRTRLRLIGRPAIIGVRRGHRCSSWRCWGGRSRCLRLRKGKWNLRQARKGRYQDKPSHCLPPLPKFTSQRHLVVMVPGSRASSCQDTLKGSPRQVARPEGLEPPTPRFVVWCSIQLSYGRSGRRGRSGPVPSRQGPTTGARAFWAAQTRRAAACRQALPTLYARLGRSVAQPGRALCSGRRGRRFESSHSDQPRSPMTSLLAGC